MAKKVKGNRVQVILECTEQKNRNICLTNNTFITKNKLFVTFFDKKQKNRV